jgi:hypothetical protein
MLINLTGEIDRAAARKAGVRGVEFGMRYDTDDLKQIARLLERKLVRVTPSIPCWFRSPSDSGSSRSWPTS